ncbi:hypothetical protein DH26_gp002 [Chloriridovirus anopheles1]|uniref:Uncharacterized protein n=1 Tax=Chloriridovirus anopheles1 TaxID=1465751 RepID=W8R9I4_9VIRU|nr:hypothetical protein DH26_gp002 [Anopheles minimus iridovirus]AHL67506.1 hypothetical protein AMIV_002 [Anopheles minimus iridovirus]
MAFHDIHELKNVNAEGSAFLINDLTYLKDDMFLPVDKLKSSIGKTCSSEGVGWISKDSTTLDAQRAVRMCLDSVPMNSYKKDLGTIYDKTSDIVKYKGLYYNREDLPGQIQYYVDPGMTNPFFSPLFPANTRALGAVYIDPMNNAHYDFRRATGSCSAGQPLDCDDCGLAEFRDSQSHREDMQASIMRKRNRVEFEPVYFNFMTRYHP